MIFSLIDWGTQGVWERGRGEKGGRGDKESTNHNMMSSKFSTRFEGHMLKSHMNRGESLGTSLMEELVAGFYHGGTGYVPLYTFVGESGSTCEGRP